MTDFLHVEKKLRIQNKIISLGPNMFQCADCAFSTSYKNSLVNHIEAKHIGEIFTCHKCDKEFNSRVALSMHDSRIHKMKPRALHEDILSKIRCVGPNEFSCSECGYGCLEKVKMIAHIQTNHIDEDDTFLNPALFCRSSPGPSSSIKHEDSHNLAD